jgi:oligopeptide/dipeptide ABC transporter ATP-binding protein
LIGSLPRVDQSEHRRLVNIEGAPPDLFAAPVGCPFAPRCPFAYERCREENPPLDEVQAGHEVACWWDVNRGKPRYDR